MNLPELLKKISAESSTNKKMEILALYKDTENLKDVLYKTYSRRVKFYIKQIPDYTPLSKSKMPFAKALKELDKLSAREVTGRAGISHLQGILSALPKEEAQIIEFIIDKSCDLGMGSTNINKVFPKLIEKTPYMGARPFEKEAVIELLEEGECFSQIKMDGRYCNALVRHKNNELESRAGEFTNVKGAKFLDELDMFEECVLNGELTIPGISRYESNGIIASIISINNKRDMHQNVEVELEEFEEKHGSIALWLERITFTVWDTVTVTEYFAKKSTTPYKDRLSNARNLIEEAGSDKVVIIRSKRIKTYEEAIDHFKEVISQDEEGTIIKSVNGEWTDGKPKWQLKVKLEMDIDMKVVDFNYGTGKNSEVISSIVTESSDGLVKTTPAGINEKMMKYVTDNQKKLRNTILTLTCSGLSKDRDGNYSVLHPRFKQFRDDKIKADSLKDIQRTEQMIKQLS